MTGWKRTLVGHMVAHSTLPYRHDMVIGPEESTGSVEDMAETVQSQARPDPGNDTLPSSWSPLPGDLVWLSYGPKQEQASLHGK